MQTMEVDRNGLEVLDRDEIEESNGVALAPVVVFAKRHPCFDDEPIGKGTFQLFRSSDPEFFQVTLCKGKSRAGEPKVEPDAPTRVLAFEYFEREFVSGCSLLCVE